MTIDQIFRRYTTYLNILFVSFKGFKDVHMKILSFVYMISTSEIRKIKSLVLELDKLLLLFRQNCNISF